MHRQGCARRAYSVILMGLWHAEDGKHGVADVLLNDATVRVDRRDDGVEEGSLQVAQVFRIGVLGEGGEVRQISEQDGDLAAIRCGPVGGSADGLA